MKWRRVILSDECCFERGSGKLPQWVWGQSSTNWDVEDASTYNKGKEIRVGT